MFINRAQLERRSEAAFLAENYKGMTPSTMTNILHNIGLKETDGTASKGMTPNVISDALACAIRLHIHHWSSSIKDGKNAPGIVFGLGENTDRYTLGLCIASIHKALGHGPCIIVCQKKLIDVWNSTLHRLFGNHFSVLVITSPAVDMNQDRNQEQTQISDDYRSFTMCDICLVSEEILIDVWKKGVKDNSNNAWQFDKLSLINCNDKDDVMVGSLSMTYGIHPILLTNWSVAIVSRDISHIGGTGDLYRSLRFLRVIYGMTFLYPNTLSATDLWPELSNCSRDTSFLRVKEYKTMLTRSNTYLKKRSDLEQADIQILQKNANIKKLNTSALARTHFSKMCYMQKYTAILETDSERGSTLICSVGDTYKYIVTNEYPNSDRFDTMSLCLHAYLPQGDGHQTSSRKRPVNPVSYASTYKCSGSSPIKKKKRVTTRCRNQPLDSHSRDTSISTRTQTTDVTPAVTVPGKQKHPMTGGKTIFPGSVVRHDIIHKEVCSEPKTMVPCKGGGDMIQDKDIVYRNPFDDDSEPEDQESEESESSSSESDEYEQRRNNDKDVSCPCYSQLKCATVICSCPIAPGMAHFVDINTTTRSSKSAWDGGMTNHLDTWSHEWTKSHRKPHWERIVIQADKILDMDIQSSSEALVSTLRSLSGRISHAALLDAMDKYTALRMVSESSYCTDNEVEERLYGKNRHTEPPCKIGTEQDTIVEKCHPKPWCVVWYVNYAMSFNDKLVVVCHFQKTIDLIGIALTKYCIEYVSISTEDTKIDSDIKLRTFEWTHNARVLIVPHDIGLFGHKLNNVTRIMFMGTWWKTEQDDALIQAIHNDNEDVYMTAHLRIIWVTLKTSSRLLSLMEETMLDAWVHSKPSLCKGPQQLLSLLGQYDSEQNKTVLGKY